MQKTLCYLKWVHTLIIIVEVIRNKKVFLMFLGGLKQSTRHVSVAQRHLATISLSPFFDPSVYLHQQLPPTLTVCDYCKFLF